MFNCAYCGRYQQWQGDPLGDDEEQFTTCEYCNKKVKVVCHVIYNYIGEETEQDEVSK